MTKLVVVVCNELWVNWPKDRVGGRVVHVSRPTQSYPSAMQQRTPPKHSVGFGV
jgi:hypothetical protein